MDAKLIPSRYLYMIALLDFLREAGPSVPAAAYDWLVIQGIARQEDLDLRQKDGGSRFHKEVRFARQELLAAGLIQAGLNGQWAISP